MFFVISVCFFVFGALLEYLERFPGKVDNARGILMFFFPLLFFFFMEVDYSKLDIGAVLHFGSFFSVFVGFLD
jgi:hypothetical protein